MSELRFPVDVRDLIPMLPHRPPMVWIDEVHMAEPLAGTCAILLSSDRLDVDAHGFCLAYAPVEWIAEAFGYARVCCNLARGDSSPIKRAFLVGVTELEIVRPIAAVGRIFVDWRLTRELPPLALVEGRIRRDDDVLVRAHLRLFYER